MCLFLLERIILKNEGLWYLLKNPVSGTLRHAQGEEGRIHVNRARITGKPIEDLTAADRARFAEEVVRLYKGRPIDPDSVSTSGTNSGLTAVAATPGGTLYAVGEGALLLRGDGSAWERIYGGQDPINLWAVWADARVPDRCSAGPAPMPEPAWAAWASP